MTIQNIIDRMPNNHFFNIDIKTDENEMSFNTAYDITHPFLQMISRLNVYHGLRFHAELIDNYRIKLKIDSDELEKNLNILAAALQRKEYDYYYPKGNRYFDIKLGYSCNNNCFHCVVKPNIWAIKAMNPQDIILDSGYGMWCKQDLTYEQVIDQLRKQNWSEIGHVVLTGGEPTIRRDFIEILKFFYYCLPDVKLALQTNGRNLSSIALVRSIYRYSRKIDFVVAVHGTEQTHNDIVNNRKERGNPYQEVINGIKNLKDIYGQELSLRIEVVISNKNKHELVALTKFLHEELELTNIGFSYPHLEGFSSKDILEKAPTLAELVPVLKALNDYNKEHEDLLIQVEEVPDCVYHQFDNDIRIVDMSHEPDSNVLVSYLGAESDNFMKDFLAAHTKLPQCLECVKFDKCNGLWYETATLNTDSIIPIKEKKHA